jgi:hypothetical protein
MTYLATARRLLLSSGITTALALCCVRVLAQLRRHDVALVVVGGAALFILILLIHAILTRRSGRNHTREQFLVQSTLVLCKVPPLWIFGRALWVFLTGLLLIGFGVGGRATILTIESRCDNTRCWHIATYKIWAEDDHVAAVAQSDLSSALVRRLRPGQIVGIHYLPQLPKLAEIDDNIALEGILWAWISILTIDPLVLFIMIVLRSHLRSYVDDLPPAAVYDDPYLRYKWFMDALRQDKSHRTRR